MHCPFCKNRLNPRDGRHIYRCNKNMKVWTKEGIKYEFLHHNFPVISTKNTLFDEYVIKLKSLPEIRQDYNISFKNIIFLLDFHGIKKRTMKVSSRQISVKKYKKTLLAKYGVDNISKLQSIKDKKKEVIFDFYPSLETLKNLKDMFISKNINLNRQDLDETLKKNWTKLYKKCHSYWIDLNDEQKEYLFDKVYSQIESKVTNCLDKLNVTYTRRFMVGRNFFDIKIKNILIDVNGDLWHANPKLYKANELLKFPFKKVKAKSVWEKDRSKNELAKSYNYKVFIIWENDMKDMDDNQLIEYLKENIFLS
jgi:G:T-mismatch repair DNA endonuclease (very short patch repair protein)